MKFKRRKTEDGFLYIFYCPGCHTYHNFDVREGGWTFDDNWDNPTFSPSLALPNCHLFVRNGIIDFLGDCKHHLAGQKIPMVELQ